MLLHFDNSVFGIGTYCINSNRFWSHSVKVLPTARAKLPRIISTSSQHFAIEKRTLLSDLYNCHWGKKQTNTIMFKKSRIFGSLSRFLFNGWMTQFFLFLLPLLLKNNHKYFSLPPPCPLHCPISYFFLVFKHVLILCPIVKISADLPPLPTSNALESRPRSMLSALFWLQKVFPLSFWKSRVRHHP